MQVVDVQSALQPIVDRIITTPVPFDLEVAADLHRDLLDAFGEAIGTDFRPTPTAIPEDQSWLYVYGVFGYRRTHEDIRLMLKRRQLKEGGEAIVALIAELHLPTHARRFGAGTALIHALLALWARLGVAEVTATATEDGSCAFASWGFELDPSSRLTRPSAVREELMVRSGLDGSPSPPLRPPPELADELRHLLGVDPHSPPALDIREIYALATADGDRYGARLLHGVMWPARLIIGPTWSTEPDHAIL
jgi:hypothetical protein